MTVAAKTGSASDLGGWLGIQFYNTYGVAITGGHASAHVTNTGWTKYTLTTVVPSSFGLAKIWASKYAGVSYLYVDDFTLVKQ